MKQIKVRKLLCAFISTLMLICANVALTVSVSAEDATEQAVVSEQAVQESGEAKIIDSYEALREATTITSDDIARGTAIASPIVKLMNVAVAVLVALLGSWILFNSVIDLLCLCVNPFAKRVLALNSNPQQVPDDWISTIAKLASEQAVHALMIASGGGATSGGANAMGGMGGIGGMGPMGGMGGMGGMGPMGPMGSAGGVAPAKPKSTLPIYLRKRVVMLILFGVCIVVFTCTTFTDIGIKLGNMLINGVSGLNL